MLNARFLFWAAIMIASLMLIGLCSRVLALHAVPVSESLIFRGLSCLVLVYAFARHHGYSLLPKSIKTQALRAALAGLALSFLTLSYNWLTASSVSVLSNVDVPLLVALGPVVGVQAPKSTRVLALVSILFLVWYVTGLESQAHLVFGLSSLLLGTLLLCFGFFFIKKSMQEENQAVAILTPALAIIVYGLGEKFLSGGAPSFVAATSFSNLGLCVLSGCGMFFAYVSTMKLYEVTDIATAEFPTLLSAIAIQPVEYVLLNEPLSAVYLGSSIGFVAVTYVIMNLQRGSV